MRKMRSEWGVAVWLWVVFKAVLIYALAPLPLWGAITVAVLWFAVWLVLWDKAGAFGA